MPSTARLIAGTAYSRAASVLACSHGSSICTTSAPAAKRSRISSFTAPARSMASSDVCAYASLKACWLMVNGPGSVIFTGRSVFARRKRRSSTSTGRVRRTGPTTRGTEFFLPVRPTTIAGWSMSMPSSAVADQCELRRRRRRIGAAQRSEAREVLVGIDQRPRERQDRHAVADGRRLAQRRAVREPELAEEPERGGRELASRRAEPDRPQLQRLQRADAAREHVRLLPGLEPGPLLVAPAVIADLVPRSGDRRQRLRIQLGVEPLDEERRAQPRLLEQREDPRQRPRHGEVPAERLALGVLAARQLGDLAEVVERDGVDGGHGCSATTRFSSRPTRSISTTTRSPSRSSTFGSRR